MSLKPVNREHIYLVDDGTEAHRAGRNRFVVGCILRNAAAADPAVPNLKLGQKPWQRFTQRHSAAIDVQAEANLLVANNRLPDQPRQRPPRNQHQLYPRIRLTPRAPFAIPDFLFPNSPLEILHSQFPLPPSHSANSSLEILHSKFPTHPSPP